MPGKLDNQKFDVVGGGPVGSITALLAAQAGANVEINEGRPDPRGQNLSRQSVNLALSRGLAVLEEAGVREEIEALSTPMHGRVLHLVDETTGKPIVNADHSYGADLLSIDRGQLATRLIELLAEHPNVEIHFDSRCEGVDFDSRSIILDRNGERITHHAPRVIGADGSNSRIRRAMKSHLGIEAEDREKFPIGYKEFTIPPSETGAFRLDHAEGLHIWPRGQYMFIALPNRDGSFTCTLFLPLKNDAKTEYSFESFQTERELTDFFKEKFPDIAGLIPNAWEQFSANGGRGELMHTVECKTDWNFEDFLVLVGDAAHGVVPFYGLGLNTGLESASKLVAMLRENTRESLAEVYKRYEEARRMDARAVAEASKYNYREMAELSPQDLFKSCRKLETLFSLKNPGLIGDLHYLMTFTKQSQHEVWTADRQKEAILVEAFDVFPDLLEQMKAIQEVDKIKAEEVEKFLPREVEAFIRTKLV